MLGAFSVGKTSLVRRFVTSIFSEKYHTTVGVKIDKKSLTVGGVDMSLLIWDIQGEDDTSQTPLDYLHGAAGYLLVMDGTRPRTLDIGERISKRVEARCGKLPFVVLLNKVDLTEDWQLDEHAMDDLEKRGWKILKTSAKTGLGVEEAFLTLSRGIRATGQLGP